MGIFEYLKRLIQELIDFNKTGVVERGNQKAVTGGAVYDYLAENALKIKSITTTTVTNQQGISTQSYDNYVQGDKNFIPVSITAKTTGYDAVDVHYVLDETNRLIYFIPKDLTGSAIPSGRTVSMTIRYFEI